MDDQRNSPPVVAATSRVSAPAVAGLGAGSSSPDAGPHGQKHEEMAGATTGSSSVNTGSAQAMTTPVTTKSGAHVRRETPRKRDRPDDSASPSGGEQSASDDEGAQRPLKRPTRAKDHAGGHPADPRAVTSVAAHPPQAPQTRGRDHDPAADNDSALDCGQSSDTPAKHGVATHAVLDGGGSATAGSVGTPSKDGAGEASPSKPTTDAAPKPKPRVWGLQGRPRGALGHCSKCGQEGHNRRTCERRQFEAQQLAQHRSHLQRLQAAVPTPGHRHLMMGGASAPMASAALFPPTAMPGMQSFTAYVARCACNLLRIVCCGVLTPVVRCCPVRSSGWRGVPTPAPWSSPYGSPSLQWQAAMALQAGMGSGDTAPLALGHGIRVRPPASTSDDRTRTLMQPWLGTLGARLPRPAPPMPFPASGPMASHYAGRQALPYGSPDDPYAAFAGGVQRQQVPMPADGGAMWAPDSVRASLLWALRPSASTPSQHSGGSGTEWLRKVPDGGPHDDRV